MSETGRNSGPLNGWRAIAGYLGRNQSTVKRWATERGLPVHRPRGSAARKGVPVYAFAPELDGWLRSNSEQAALLKEPEVEWVAAPEMLPAKPARTTEWTLFPLPALVAAILLLACGLAMALFASGQSLESASPPADTLSAQARDLYLRGLYHQNLRTREGLSTAIDLFTQARDSEPDSPQILAALAQTYNLAPQYGVLEAEIGYAQGRNAAEAALELDPDYPGAVAALAFNTFYWVRDFALAYDLFEQALDSDPENGQINHWYALAAMHDRRFDVALEAINVAQRLMPESPSILANKGLILHHAGRTDEALGILEPLARNQPNLLSAVSYLATIYLAEGRNEEFIDAYGQAASISGSATQQLVAAAARYGLESGDRETMLQAMFETQVDLHGQNRETAFQLAVTASYLGDTNTAVYYLREAVDQHEDAVLGIRLELANSIHQAPGFGRLVSEVGFNQQN